MKLYEIDSGFNPTPKLKNFATIKTNFSDADFWIIRRGSLKTVGKPVKEFNPEHIGISVTRTDIINPDYLYYVFMHLHSQGYFANHSSGVTNLVNITPDIVKNIPLSFK